MEKLWVNFNTEWTSILLHEIGAGYNCEGRPSRSDFLHFVAAITAIVVRLILILFVLLVGINFNHVVIIIVILGIVRFFGSWLLLLFSFLFGRIFLLLLRLLPIFRESKMSYPFESKFLVNLLSRLSFKGRTNLSNSMSSMALMTSPPLIVFLLLFCATLFEHDVA